MPNRMYDYGREQGAIGIEFEFINARRDTERFSTLLRKYLYNWNIVHDASCEASFQSLSQVPIVFSDTEKRSHFSDLTILPFETYGGEVTSPILAEKDISSNVHNMCEFFTKQREFVDKRSSLHIHCNVGNAIPIYALKNLVQMILASESFLYRAGGMGNVNRGIYNHFIFQRPYCEYGPPVVRDDGNNYPIFESSSLLSSGDKATFFSYYGDSINCIQHDIKYVTQRYMGINFYSILKRESLEFRYANTTLRPSYVLAWIRFVRAFIKKSLMTVEDFFSISRPLNYKMTSSDVISFLDLFDLSCTDKCTLYDIWETSGDLSDFKIVPVFSHLENPSRFEDGNNPYDPYPSDLLVTDVERINIHTLQQETMIVYEQSKINYMRLTSRASSLENVLSKQPKYNKDQFIIDDEVIAKLGRKGILNAPVAQDADDDNVDDDIKENDEEECYDYLSVQEIVPTLVRNRPNDSIRVSLETGEKMAFLENGVSFTRHHSGDYYVTELKINRQYIHEVIIVRGGEEHRGYRIVDRFPALSFQTLLHQLTYIY